MNAGIVGQFGVERRSENLALTQTDHIAVDRRFDRGPLADLGNGKYSFVMPDGKVSVEAEFVKTAATSFADVPANAYFADAVKWAVDKGVTNGLSDTMFGPYASCTRARRS